MGKDQLQTIGLQKGSSIKFMAASLLTPEKCVVILEAEKELSPNAKAELPVT